MNVALRKGAVLSQPLKSWWRHACKGRYFGKDPLGSSCCEKTSHPWKIICQEAIETSMKKTERAREIIVDKAVRLKVAYSGM